MGILHFEVVDTGRSYGSLYRPRFRIRIGLLLFTFYQLNRERPECPSTTAYTLYLEIRCAYGSSISINRI